MKTICKQSFIHTFLAGIYIVLVAEFMSHASGWFGKADTAVTPVAVLLLATLSALVVGGLIIGKPIMLYIDGKKKEAIQMLIASAGWLFLFFAIALVAMAVIK